MVLGFTPPLLGAHEGEGTCTSNPNETDRKEFPQWDWTWVPTRRGAWSLAPSWMLARLQKHRARLMGVRECLKAWGIPLNIQTDALLLTTALWRQESIFLSSSIFLPAHISVFMSGYRKGLEFNVKLKFRFHWMFQGLKWGILSVAWGTINGERMKMPQGSLGAVWKKRKPFPVYLQRFCNTMCVCAKSLQSCPTLCEPKTVACQAPLSMRFSRREYWSGLLCPPPRDLPNPGIEPVYLTSLGLVGRFFSTSVTWEALATPQHRSKPGLRHAPPWLLFFYCFRNTMPLPPWSPLGINPDGPFWALWPSTLAVVISFWIWDEPILL